MIIFDGKAVMRHTYAIGRGKDPDSFTSELGNEISTAAFGFNNFMERYMLPLLEIHEPIDIVVAHDAGRVYRDTIYPDYKKTKSREEQDPEEKEQQEIMYRMMKSFFASMGCIQAQVKGVEADDLIAYLCQQIKEPIHVYTVDADLLQLQGDHEHVKVLLKLEFFEDDEHKGIPLKYTSLSKSMLGDASDNYNGVPGFGPAKWDMLVEQFGYDGIEELEACVANNDYKVIEEVLADTDEPENKALRLLYDHRNDWHKAYTLAKLHPELCWKPRGKHLTKIDWYKRVPNAQRVYAVLREMGCADLFTNKHIDKWLPVSWAIQAGDIDEEFYADIEKEFKKSPVVAFDYETYPSENAMPLTPQGEDYVDVKEALIAGASFAFGENLQYTVYLPVNHLECDNVHPGVIGKLLKIAESVTDLVAHNISFELAVTKTNLDFWLAPLYDTALMQSYADENEELALKPMSKRLLNYNQKSYKETVTDPETGEMRTMDQLTLEEVIEYGCDDATVTAHLWLLHRIVMRLEGSLEFYEEYESSTVHNLVLAYLEGCEIDWDALEAQKQKDQKMIEDNDARLRKLLEKHCKKPNASAAAAFVEAEKEYKVTKAKDKAVSRLEKEGIKLESDEALEIVRAEEEEALEAFHRDWLDGSRYVPYKETPVIAEFLPTPTQFKALTEHLGFSEPLEVKTQKGMKEWLVQQLAIDMDADTAFKPELTGDQQKFCDLLGPAISQINKREGEDYDNFIRFCTKHNPAEDKVTTEGDELNTGSPNQMQMLLYGKLGLPVRLRNLPQKGSFRDKHNLPGSPATDSLAMETAMAEDTEEGSWQREAIECVKKIKEGSTRMSLYHNPYPLWKHPTDGRIHPQIRDCGTVTRRPSGTSPNVLQVSKHQEEAVMRSIFIGNTEDELIVSIDFSQQELRIMASECQDENLMACYIGEDRRDVHSSTAAGIAKVTYADYIEVYNDSKHELHKKFVNIRKRPAKATNFLISYLGEAPTLSRRLIIPLEEAESMMNAAYMTYPGIQPWQQDVIRFAERHGYSQTAYGNRRHANSTLYSNKKGTRKRMQRQLVNFVIQGCAADILKVVLSQCWDTHLWRDTGATLIGPVYDEITSSVPRRSVVEYINRLVDIMSLTPPGHKVPMEADVSLGIDWQKQIEIGVRPSKDKILAAVEEAYK